MIAARCPKCSGSLKERILKGQTAHVCTGCEGMWIGVDEMSSAARKPMSLWSAVEAELDRDAHASGMTCPECQRNPLQATDFQGAELDWCAECRGVFLDPGELREVAKSHYRPWGEVVGELGKDAAGRGAEEAAGRVVFDWILRFLP